MNTKELKAVLETCLKTGVNAYIKGSPGIGKSAIVKAIADENGIDLRDVRLVTQEPVDLRGLPHIVDGKVKWSTPDFWPQEGTKGILFLDEINAAPRSTQAAVYQLISNRCIGSHVLPDGWIVWAAGNLDTDGAVTTSTPTTISSRFMTIELKPELESWLEWAAANGIKTEIMSYLRFRPDNLHSFNPTKLGKHKAFATPRTWEMASKLLFNLPESVQLEAYSGVIGEAVAAEFLGFLKIYNDLPDIAKIVSHPLEADLPNEASTKYALMGALVDMFEPSIADNIFKYINRIEKEFQAMFVKDLTNKKPESTDTAALTQWAVRNADYMI